MLEAVVARQIAGHRRGEGEREGPVMFHHLIEARTKSTKIIVISRNEEAQLNESVVVPLRKGGKGALLQVGGKLAGYDDLGTRKCVVEQRSRARWHLNDATILRESIGVRNPRSRPAGE